MEKYSRFAILTNTFLHGQLERLEVDYETDVSATVKIFYKDSNDYRFDYEIQLDIPNQNVDFASHISTSMMDETKLQRSLAFEQAVCDELFRL